MRIQSFLISLLLIASSSGAAEKKNTAPVQLRCVASRPQGNYYLQFSMVSPTELRQVSGYWLNEDLVNENLKAAKVERQKPASNSLKSPGFNLMGPGAWGYLWARLSASFYTDVVDSSTAGPVTFKAYYHDDEDENRPDDVEYGFVCGRFGG